MKRLVLFITVICISTFLWGQDDADKCYNAFIEKAESLYLSKQYKDAAFTYSKAMECAGGTAFLHDRYNAACSWALANYPDSAFYHLNALVTRSNYSLYSTVARDFDLLSLHKDKRWKPLLENIKQNKIKADKKWQIKCSNEFENINTNNQTSISSYNLNVNIDVKEQKVNVNGYVNIDFNNTDSAELVLWGKTDIKKISLNTQALAYCFDTVSKSPIIYIPDGRKLTIKSNEKGKQNIYFDYVCDMKDMYGWGRSFYEEWIEIGYYTAWYPVIDNKTDFSAKLNITIDKPYKISGSGIISQKGDSWEMNQNWEGVFDIVIIASKDLKSEKLEVGNTTIEAIYTAFPQSDIDSVLVDFKYVLDFYSKLYGKPNEGDQYSKFVLNPLRGGGGYSRKNYISLKAQKYNAALGRGIAHEMAHFWWNKANSNTWHDWINEAFAEYSMMVYIKEKYGDEVFQSYVDAYRVNAANSCPIWGIDRATPEAYTALYEKGAIILYDLEQKVGTERFFEFARFMLAENVKTTDEFLTATQNSLGKDTRNWLENKLKAQNYE